MECPHWCCLMKCLKYKPFFLQLHRTQTCNLKSLSSKSSNFKSPKQPSFQHDDLTKNISGGTYLVKKTKNMHIAMALLMHK